MNYMISIMSVTALIIFLLWRCISCFETNYSMISSALENEFLIAFLNYFWTYYFEKERNKENLEF